MPRITSPFRKHSDSWAVNSVLSPSQSLNISSNSDNVHTKIPSNGVPEDASFWVLLRLLLWKNFKLLIRNKRSTAAEIFLPLLFTLLIVAIRFFGAETKFNEAIVFPPFNPALVPTTVQTCCNKIYYTPNTPVINDLMGQVHKNYFNQTNLNYTFVGFETERDLTHAYANSSSGTYARNDDGELSSTVLAGVVFISQSQKSHLLASNIEYSIRFPAALRGQSGLLGERFSFGMKEAWFTEILYPIVQTFGPRAKDQSTGGEPGYWTEGFLYVQHAVERELINTLTNSKTNYTINLQRFPYPAYLEDEFFVVLQPFLPLALIFSFIYTVTSISKTLVSEKERRIHESMKMMGLTNTLHWTAWFITFLATFACSVLMITILMKVHLTSASKSGGLAVLPKSDPSLVFFCFLIHGFQLISFCFFISSIFKTANAAAMTSSIVWFLFFLPYPFLQPRYSILSSRVKLVWSLMTNMGVCFCCQLFSMFEGAQTGAQWSTVFQGVTPDDTFSIADCLVVMFFNAILYFVAAVYISAVWPGAYGVGLKWYFFVTKQFWFGTPCEELEQSAEVPNNISYERCSKTVSPGIEVKNLTKKFDQVAAVECLNLTMYKNETFCLVGKNGAGKSTLVSVITGLFPPSNGTAYVAGRDIRSEMGSIRKSLGVCPQHNVLFEELTVEEHLEFFTTLKGMRGQTMDEEVTRMISAVGLASKRKCQVKTLSGGMKRKLCVGIAFCGGSQVVIVDEASSGLDVEARRAIWDLIESEKVGRTVLLTTHFMEEAELLGDKIAIMVNGRVQCCGSLLFLNHKYNGGYNLTIVMENESGDNNQIRNLVQSHVPQAEVIRSAGKELTFALSQATSNQFPGLFDAIEMQQEQLGIETFGARMTSMEDIFIRVNAEEPCTSVGTGITCDDNTTEPPHTRCLVLTQFHAMVVKKLLYVWRKRGLFCGQVLLPNVYLTVVLIVLKTIPGIFDPPPHTFDLDHYELMGKTVTVVQCQTSRICESYEHYVTNVHKRYESINTSFVNTLLSLEAPDIAAFNAKYIVGLSQQVVNGSDVLTGFFNNQPLHTPPLALNMITNAILESTNHTVRLTNHPFAYTNLDTQDTGTYWTVGFHVGYNTAFALTFVVAVYATYLVKENVIGSTHLQTISGLHPAVYWMSCFFVDFLTFLFPCCGLLVVFALFSESTEFFDLSLNGYLMLLFLSFGWAMIPVVYVMSRWFRVPAVGFAGCGVACAFSGFITILAITILELPQINQPDLAVVLHRVFLVFPTYALGRGVTQMSINNKLIEKCKPFNLEFLCDAFPDSYCCAKMQGNFLDWKEMGIGKNLVYMVCVGVGAMLILVVLESNVLSGIYGRMRKKPNPVFTDYVEDDDVKMERDRVGQQATKCFENLMVKDLTKTYGSIVAVDRLTLGVDQGQCFGLLGTNGAGKTSTFKMLVGETGADSGDAFISSYSVTHQRAKTHKLIGYCPQFDALVGELTGRETIVMFARIRGIGSRAISGIVDSIATELVFGQYIDKKVETYSGGNKRKLSTAVALIGSPKVVFLDEPTAGMDPLARRQVWAAISKRIRDTRLSVVLTSHSLEECEVLCSRLAIMKNGRMQCLGSPQQLKHKFGDGFSIAVQIARNGTDNNGAMQRKNSTLSQLSGMSTSSTDSASSMHLIDSMVRSYFPAGTECILTSRHANYLHYHVKQRNSISWSMLFKTMESIKESTGISAYSISQISLEQVFLSV